MRAHAEVDAEVDVEIYYEAGDAINVKIVILLI